ncbi:hypothetical protein NIE88_10415 [Sporolactobacillus shoreicorticis]|uniref:Uncharacterized protein n=1 Tax=Sporolactobacillus shoreicorticis TaxID=1923877 RepID=A0ABW5S9H9_9BACL|nr:hypothetical protein [Sporolactobacillus shoreicorticis]MCO7126188.1 hypothetical protein [Sporolactobacillus shoreicorticis]
MSYRVIDHIHGYKQKRFSTLYEAMNTAFQVARMQTIFADKRIHLSVMDGRRQTIEISVKQREGER